MPMKIPEKYKVLRAQMGLPPKEELSDEEIAQAEALIQKQIEWREKKKLEKIKNICISAENVYKELGITSEDLTDFDEVEIE